MKNYFNLLILVLSISLVSCEFDGFGGGFTTDTGSGSDATLHGSYANMLKVGDYLYAINDEELSTFVKTDAGIDRVNTQNVGFRVENIFHADGVLFVGSQESMHIFKIAESGIPERKSETPYSDFAGQDVGPCDPVIARDDYAYVTLSTSVTGACNRQININELRIYDVTDLSHPSVVSITAMNNPKGLGLKNNLLFVCEAHTGVVIFDISDALNPIKINELTGFSSKDLIINGDKLLVVGSKEIRQFNISDIYNIELYGTIEI